MKLVKLETCLLPSGRVKWIQTLMTLLVLYLLFMSLEIPVIFKTGSIFGSITTDSFPTPLNLISEDDISGSDQFRSVRIPERQMREKSKLSGLLFNETNFAAVSDEFSVLHKAARQAFLAGKKLWSEIESGQIKPDPNTTKLEKCPNSIAIPGSEFSTQKRMLELPCGLTLGSHITVVGIPRWAHAESEPKIALVKEGEESVMVSQFMMELQGLKTVDGEDPPRILHFNPRLKGDWSGKPVIEQNTCYRMQWGTALRCEGWVSRADEETG